MKKVLVFASAALLLVGCNKIKDGKVVEFNQTGQPDKLVSSRRSRLYPTLEQQFVGSVEIGCDPNGRAEQRDSQGDGVKNGFHVILELGFLVP